MSVMLAGARVRSGGESLKIRPISRSLTIRPLAAARRTVTVSRLDGVGRPTIEPDAQAPLPAEALLREAVDTALDSLDLLEHQARDIARRFRRQALDEAHLGLSQLVHSTQTLLRLAAMTAGAAGTDIETLCASHGITAEAQTQTTLSSLIGRQLEHDWHGLAGVIDHSFVAALASWRAVFEVLGGTPGPCGHAA